MSSDTYWVKILPVTVLKGALPANKGKQIKISEPCRMLMSEYKNYGPGGSDGDIVREVQFLRFGEYSTLSWLIDANSKYEKLKLPPMTREFTSLAVKGSVWEFERDWVFQGYDASPKVYTIKAGTRITIDNNKMPMKGTWSHSEKYIEVKPNPDITRCFGGPFIPAREASAYLKLVTPGKVKTYWKLEKLDGTPLVKKNFATLSAVKASVRVRFNLVKPSTDDEYVPEWLDNSDGWMEKPTREEGVVAVQYDHATKKEIYREDLFDYVILSVLKS